MPTEEKKSEKKPGKKRPKSKPWVSDTHVKHHRNGSHTTTHTVEGGGEPISYASADLDAVKAGMDEHVGGGGETEEAAAPNPVMERLGQPTPAGG